MGCAVQTASLQTHRRVSFTLGGHLRVSTIERYDRSPINWRLLVYEQVPEENSTGLIYEL